MKLSTYARMGVPEKLIEEEFDKCSELLESDRKKLFGRLKRMKPKRIVAVYTAARMLGDLQLAAAARDKVFREAIAGTY